MEEREGAPGSTSTPPSAAQSAPAYTSLADVDPDLTAESHDPKQYSSSYGGKYYLSGRSIRAGSEGGYSSSTSYGQGPRVSAYQARVPAPRSSRPRPTYDVEVYKPSGPEGDRPRHKDSDSHWS